MKKFRLTLLLLCFIIIPSMAFAQELNFEVSINSSQVSGTDQRVYESLKESAQNFLNNTIWTSIKFEQHERIEGAMVITIKEKSSNNFSAQINVVLRRPSFKATYNTPLFNYVDNNFDFSYVESQPLDFSDNTYMSNLTSTLAFYAYYSMGLYFDTFGLYGGDTFFKAAEQVVNAAQSASESGWKAFDSNKNRYWLLENMTNASYRPIRQYMYEYHRLGIDVMSAKAEEGRAAITNSLSYLKQIHSEKPSLFFLQIINDTKTDEWKNIYSEGSQSEKTKAVNILREIDPSHANEYEELLSGRK